MESAITINAIRAKNALTLMTSTSRISQITIPSIKKGIKYNGFQHFSNLPPLEKRTNLNARRAMMMLTITIKILSIEIIFIPIWSNDWQIPYVKLENLNNYLDRDGGELTRGIRLPPSSVRRWKVSFSKAIPSLVSLGNFD